MTPQALLTFVLLVTSLSAMAQNRDGDDAIFNRPNPESVFTQFILGASELATAVALWPTEMNQLQKNIQIAESNLLQVTEAFYSEADRGRAIEALIQNRNSYQYGKSTSSLDNLSESAANRLEQLKSRRVIQMADRQAAMAAAELEITTARNLFLESAKKSGRLSARVKKFRQVGGVLLLMDVGGRIYVWNALNADPTFSPGAHLIFKSIGKIFN